MNDRENGTVLDPRRRLSDAIREVKIAAAERDDVVVEMREATRMRLELLAQELQPVFAEVPADDILFDFAISSGLQPRLWIDAVSHVAMGRDRRTYRFLRDTRLGRTVIAEATDIRTMADKVTRYIAERMIERQRWLDGGVEPVVPATAGRTSSQNSLEADKVAEARAVSAAAAAAAVAQHFERASAKPTEPRAVPALVDEAARSAERGRLRSFLSGLSVVLIGALAGLAVLAAIYWDRVAAYVAAN